MLEIIVGLITIIVSIQSSISLSVNIDRDQEKYLDGCIKEAVEHAYTTYIYDLKQEAKKMKRPLLYDMDTACHLANTHFDGIYTESCIYTSRHMPPERIYTKIKKELKYQYARNIASNPDIVAT